MSNALAPAVSRVGNRLAFVTEKFDVNIWRIDLKGQGQKPGLPFRFISSTEVEYIRLFRQTEEDRLHVATLRDGGNLALRK